MPSRLPALATITCAVALLLVPAAAGRLMERTVALADVTAVSPAARFVSPGGSDSGQCTRAKACRSFNRAFQVARPGDVVEVAGGNYPEQTISRARRSGPTDVVFRASAGAKVMVTGEVFIDGSHLELRGMRFDEGWQVRQGADDVTFRNISSGHLFIFSASNVRVLGGDIGPGRGRDYDSIISTARAGAPPPTNIVIDGVRFHDWARPEGSDDHTECLQVGSGVRVAIRNSRFDRCATHDIFIRSWGSLNGAEHPLRDWTIENNYFGETLDGYWSIYVAQGADAGQPCENFLVRNNTALQNMRIDCPVGGEQGIRVESNIQVSMSRGECNSRGARWNFNVYTSGRRCGPDDRVGQIRLVDPGALDLRLRPGSAAIDRGNPNSFPGRDIDGERRPQGKAPDAGADELG